jgi:hypothetical protein
MRIRVRRSAHLFERLGLAMAGAACGLFVSAHVGSSIGALTSQAFLLIMMLIGAIGFYFGIDTPHRLAFHADDDPSIEAAEFLTAVGTFCATLTAFASVAIIILREEPHIAWTWLIMAGWVAGISMQIVAGAKARSRTAGKYFG